MEEEDRIVFHHHFFKNPVLILDAFRAKLFKCASLPQQVFDENFRRSEEYSICRSLGLEVFPYKAYVSRIISSASVTPVTQFFVSRRPPRRIEKIERSFLDGRLSLERARRKVIHAEGEYLGYPRCCVRSYAESKEGLPAESRVLLECISEGIFDELIDALRKNELLVFHQFFTSGFYPCSVRCRRAERIGKKLCTELEDYAVAFSLRSMVIALHLLCTAYKASRFDGLLSREAKKFFGERRDILPLVKSTHSHISTITAFTNEFIRRIIRPRFG